MYGQIVAPKIFSLSLLKLESFNGAFNKGLALQKREEWHELLLNVASQSCRQSFKKLFNHFYPLLIGQGIKGGVSREQAAELAQETMHKAWKQAASYDSSKGDVSLWLYIIARNLRYDYFRKQKNDPLNLRAQEIYSVTDSNLVDEKNLSDLFEVSQLREHVEKLNHDQRDIIFKIYFEGLTQQEVSAQDNIPLGTVKSRVRLALATIKKLMEEKC